MNFILFTASHELVHMMREGSPEHFKALADFLVENYQKKGVSVTELVRKEMLRNTKLNPDEAFEEIIAQSCESFLRDITLSEKAERLYSTSPETANKVKAFLKRVRDRLIHWLSSLSPQSREGRMVLEMKDALSHAYDLYIDGVTAAAKNLRNMENTTGEGGGKMQSRIGTTDDGRGIYKTNYPMNTPKSLKQADLIKLVQNVWSKNPISLQIVENGKSKNIMAQFNPSLTQRSDLAKMAFGNHKGTGSDQRITLNLASDFYQIAEESSFVRSKKETGKTNNPTHTGVTEWLYFITDLVYEEDDGTQIDCYMNIDVKKNSEGNWFYSFAIEKGTAPQTLLAVVTDKSATVPTNIISDSTENSNTQNRKNSDPVTYDDNGNVVPLSERFNSKEKDIRYQLREDVNGNTFVDVDTSIYDETDGASVAQVIAAIIQNRFHNLIEANGQKIRINATTNAEWRRSNDATKLMRKVPSVYDDKMKVIGNADEILVAAQNWIGEQKYHNSKNKIVEFARGNVLYRVGKNGYAADVLVGTLEDGAALLYDLVDIHEIKIAEAPVSKEGKTRLSSQRTSTMDRISQNDDNVKYQDRYDVLDDDLWLSDEASTTDVLAHHFVTNNEAIGEVLKKTANVEVSKQDLERRIRKVLNKYGVTALAKDVYGEVKTVLDVADSVGMSGDDIVTDLNRIMSRAIANSEYSLDMEDYKDFSNFAEFHPRFNVEKFSQHLDFHFITTFQVSKNRPAKAERLIFIFRLKAYSVVAFFHFLNLSKRKIQRCSIWKCITHKFPTIFQRAFMLTITTIINANHIIFLSYASYKNLTPFLKPHYSDIIILLFRLMLLHHPNRLIH